MKGLTPQEMQTVRYYDENASKWVSSHDTKGFWRTELDEFKKLLPFGKVLEVGSGGGRDAKELIKLGYDYVGTDISEELLKQARKQNPGITFLKQSVYELHFSENTFDGFWASAVLLHVPKARINEALTSIHTVVKPDGFGFIAVKQGNDEKVEEEGRFFAYYSDDEFRSKLVENQFEIISSHIRPMTEKTIWLIYLVKIKK